ncbi:MAG: hypothetical protein D6820_05540, partial [Lentisphaerae bacterium]
FVLFLLGEKDAAIKKLDLILKLDPFERRFYEMGWPNTYSRLRAEFEEGRMFATQEDLKHFKGKLRTAIMAADLYYEMERWEDARERYVRFDRKYGKRLDRVARAYVDLMLAFSASTTRRKTEAYRRFSAFESEKRYYGTPSWPRAMFWLATYYQNKPETRPHAIKCLRRVYETIPKSETGGKALLTIGLYYYNFGDFEKAHEHLQACLREYPGTWMAKGAQNILRALREKRENQQKGVKQ